MSTPPLKISNEHGSQENRPAVGGAAEANETTLLNMANNYGNARSIQKDTMFCPLQIAAIFAHHV